MKCFLLPPPQSCKNRQRLPFPLTDGESAALQWELSCEAEASWASVDSAVIVSLNLSLIPKRVFGSGNSMTSWPCIRVGGTRLNTRSSFFGKPQNLTRLFYTAEARHLNSSLPLTTERVRNIRMVFWRIYRFKKGECSFTSFTHLLNKHVFNLS